MQGSGINPLGYLVIAISFLVILAFATGSPAVTVEVEVVSIGSPAEMEEAGREDLRVGDVIDLEITEDQLNHLKNYPEEVVCLTWGDMAIATELTDALSECEEPIEVVLVSSP